MSRPEIYAAFKSLLLKRMGDLGLNQERLAARMRTNQSTVQRWLSGSWPRAWQLPGLASALEMTVDQLLGVAPAPSESGEAHAVAKVAAANQTRRPPGAAPEKQAHG